MSIHTSKSYERELQKIRENILILGGRVERVITQSTRALLKNDLSLGYKIIDEQSNIFRDERVIDQMCLEVIATRQPMGRDLRFITSVLKMVTYLERLGNLGVNIAKRACKLNNQQSYLLSQNLNTMANLVNILVKDTINAFLHLNIKMALDVIRRDDEVDELYHKCFSEYVVLVSKNDKHLNAVLNFLSIVKWYERMGDHCVNLAKIVIYLVTGSKEDTKKEGALLCNS